MATDVSQVRSSSNNAAGRRRSESEEGEIETHGGYESRVNIEMRKLLGPVKSELLDGIGMGAALWQTVPQAGRSVPQAGRHGLLGLVGLK